MKTSKPRSTAEWLEKHGVRSGLEAPVQQYLIDRDVDFGFEKVKLKWVPPQKTRTYTPDFILWNTGIIIETKGKFDTADRQKMIHVKAQHPDLDIRMVFSRSTTTLASQQHAAFSTWAKSKGLTVPRTGPRRLELRDRFDEHLKSIGKRPPSRTTYADWCRKNGYLFADLFPPVEWLEEPPNKASLAALKELTC